MLARPTCSVVRHSSLTRRVAGYSRAHTGIALNRVARCSRVRTAATACPATHQSSAPVSTFEPQDDLVLSDAQRQTIYALSTPPGRAGIAVIRLSGPDVLTAWARIVRPTDASRKYKDAHDQEPLPWKFYRCQVVHPETQHVIDDGLAVFFRGPRSFTAEHVLELHIHSGKAVISAALHALSCLPFCRLAVPGEFIRRAFAAGRLDLTQVEGLKDLINAETESQRKLAMRATSGALKSWLEGLRQSIIKCLGLVEAMIDFEQEDIEDGVFDQARAHVITIRQTVLDQLSDFRRGEIYRSGVRLAIYGPPNAGKSSLFNTLAQRDAAIVTDIPGTTRDILEVSLDLSGLPVIVVDTAGLRDTDDIVEKIGVSRATEQVASADASLCVLSLPEILNLENVTSRPVISPSLASIMESEQSYALLNKADLLTSTDSIDLPKLFEGLNVPKAWIVSLTTGEGVKAFLDEFGALLRNKYNVLQDAGEDIPLIANARHREHLESMLRFLEAFLALPADEVVLAAEELRYAAQAVGMISGRIDVEEILDVVFRDFCIGK